jgi:hypothetical protein|eukprot:COSAG06_NODE_5749_length_3293_cov_23.132749_5_plen_60_part_00
MMKIGIMYRSSQVARVLGHVGERQQERDRVIRHVRKIPCRVSMLLSVSCCGLGLILVNE